MLIGPFIVIFIFLALTAEAPPPGNVCDLPKVVGTCNARIKRFHYDVHSGTCGEFYYNGCDGNKNNFRTKEECKTVCNKRVCTLPLVEGPAGGVVIQRWFYNSDTMKCETFTYGGLNGNMNNFKTKKECERLCKGVKRDPCGQRRPCAQPFRRANSCLIMEHAIRNGVDCTVGCPYCRKCGQGFCPKDPQVTCASKCISDRDCNGKKLCCSKCCRVPADRKPGKCPNDSSQLTVQRTCYLRKSECERDSQCDGNRKCCRFSCKNFCVDPDYAEFRKKKVYILTLPPNNI